MPSAFVPFMSSARNAAAPALNVPSQTDAPQAAGAFAALVSNTAATNPATTAKSVAGGCAAQPGHVGKPTVSIQKEGDHIKLIRIQCGCGEVVELECNY